MNNIFNFTTISQTAFPNYKITVQLSCNTYLGLLHLFLRYSHRYVTFRLLTSNTRFVEMYYRLRLPREHYFD